MAKTDVNFDPFDQKMAAAGCPPIAIQSFKHYYKRLVNGETGFIPESDILPLDAVPDLESRSLEALTEIGHEMLPRAVIIKLNGGLGTSMGMQRAKSLLKVKDGLSFLDVIVRQARSLSTPVPVVFMNSFSTAADTREALKRYPELDSNPVPLAFLQNQIPKVDADTLRPVNNRDNPKLDWCPPGHGDIYLALLTSGMLDILLNAGLEYAFVSNADNLGAFLEPCLLGYFIQNEFTFMMEVADRTEVDRKGGHLARLKSGRYVLREIAQTPAADQGDFQDIQRHKYFNTNNIWIHLPSLKSVMQRQKGVLGLPMIRNRKPVNPRDSKSPPIYQLETAMGAAILVFDAAGAIRVPRDRFAPVKSTNDLLAVRSDAYIMTNHYQLVPNPKRSMDPVRIDLDPDYYRLVDHFENRFPLGPPSLVNCASLQVIGDVRFGRDVILEGWASVINGSDTTYEIGDGRKIQGELRV